MDLDVKKHFSLVTVIVSTIAVSFYFFPFEFTFSKGLNTKIILALVGIVFIFFHCWKQSEIRLTNQWICSLLFAMLFSLIGFIAVEYNNTSDYSYAFYFLSFLTWMGGAYGTYAILKLFYSRVTFKILIDYLIIVCVLQCVLALLIDLNEPFKSWIDTYISQATVADDDFLNRVNRLYGIGAALDVAGARFSIVLLALAALIIQDKSIRNKRGWISVYILSFLSIAIIGNMISRTTSVGVMLALIYWVYVTAGCNLKKVHLNIWITLLLFTIPVVVLAIYLYNNDPYYHDSLRYAFEGFFNWIERGKWETGSTDKLSDMWIWPSDLRTWIWGVGKFEFMGTDIGYCRFILYNGIGGLLVFSAFFVYNAIVGISRFPMYKIFFLFLLLLTFIVWMKVATDLFIIYALFYCIDREVANE